MIFKAHQYQVNAARYHMTHPFSALLADPGTGKTAIMLMLLHELIRTGKLPRPVLVTSTLRIATQVWPAEIAKWEQFKNISYRVIHGKDKGKIASEDADIHLINNEGLQWAETCGILSKYRVLIVDELSKHKSWSAQRVKILRKHVPHFERRHGLTGSPTPKSMLDLFPQMFLCDGGASLGQYITHFRQHYFVDKGWGTYPDWQLRDGAEKMIYDRIAPHCYRLDGQDLLDMPEMTVNDIEVSIPEGMRKQSVEALRSLDLTLPPTAAAEYMQARQIAGGCVGDALVHSAKMDALGDLVDELQGKPLLVGFYYRAEGDAISKRFGAPRIDGRTSATESTKLIAAWNDRKLPMLLVQPAAGGHGLNLQAGGNDIAWYSLTDNQDDYYQFNRRIWRQGVNGAVRIHRILAKGTVDMAMVKSLEAKTGRQQALLDAIKELTR